MKRIILPILALAIPITTIGQEIASKNIKAEIGNGLSIKKAPRFNPKISQHQAAFEIEVIGNTTYDLQTNNSMARRILAYPDGRVSAIWTMSQEFGDASGAFGDRGTAYNHFDGTSWGEEPSERIENNIRTGWPSIALDADGNELIISHDFVRNELIKSVSGTIGSDSYDQSLPFPKTGAVWAKSASVDSNLYVISTINTGAVDSPGISVPMVYSRSTDGGITFAEDQTYLPGYDSNSYFNGSADNYFIDAKDSTVAIVLGGSGVHLTLWKSTDYGVSFEQIIVDSFAINAYNGDQKTDEDGDGATDTLLTNDGQVSCLIDNEGIVHVFWGNLSIFNDGEGTAGIFFENGLNHWSDDVKEIQQIAEALDCDGDSVTTLGSAASAARYGNAIFALNAQAAIDSNNTIYLIYSAAVENDTTTFDNSITEGQNFNDIYVIYSEDDGATWSETQNISASPSEEDIFPSIARFADDNIYVFWQKDEEPGTILQGSDQAGLMEMLYTAIPVADIKTGTIGNNNCPVKNTNVAQRELKSALSPNYPNPANTTSNITLSLTQNQHINLTVKNMLGQTVKEVANRNFPTGKHSFTTEVNDLPNGVYFYNLTSNGVSVMQKLVVGK
ncbi:MAG: hypothetical protein ACJATA_001841 [Sphingobacteriales bacterium]|jgi:hypothetical protein